VNTKPDNKYL